MILIVLILGLIEGITEFLPVSSTGHLIVAGHVLGFTGPAAANFEIFIQLGAILAVVWEYRVHLAAVTAGVLARHDESARRLAASLAIAFLPAAMVGFLLHGVIQRYLFGPITVGGALVVGGVAMLAIERAGPPAGISSLTAIPWARALGVGLAQTLSLFPGVSRAAATIMGGMVCGLDRRTATEFSFYLAIPTMLAATAYDLWKARDTLTGEQLGYLALGFLVAFGSALVAVRAFIRYISRHDFRPFAWYRIVFGALVLIYFLR